MSCQVSFFPKSLIHCLKEEQNSMDVLFVTVYYLLSNKNISKNTTQNKSIVIVKCIFQLCKKYI